MTLSPKPLVFDCNSLPAADVYRLLIGAVIPRPIAFVSTVDTGGTPNLAPFSFFNAISSDPPTVMISVSRKKDGSKKDTLQNIEATRQFVVNSANEWLVTQLNQCSAEYPYGVSEFDKVGLTAQASLKVRPPRVAEAAIAFECVLHDTMEIGDGKSAGSTTLIVGRVICIHVSPEVWDGKRIKPEALKPLARLGGLSYAKLGEIFDLPRPKSSE